MAKIVPAQTYFGEYSLDHWIKLILSLNIKLPPYQRYFVWDEERAEKLIESLKNKQFIPPVTIGTFVKDGKKENYILDGQQRLTTILLAKMGLFPDRDQYRKEALQPQDENDDIVDEESNVIEWTFSRLLNGSIKTIEEICESVKGKPYKKKDFNLSNSFFYNSYMSFTLVMIDSNNEEEQQNFFSSTFRNINYQGVSLQPSESREALYYLKTELQPFFSPSNDILKKHKVDFVRYLSLLAKFHISKTTEKLAYGYSRKMESFYESFVYDVVSSEKEIDKEIIKIINDRDQRMKLFINNLNKFNIDFGKNPSIIDYDLFFFGLIYISIFLKNSINDGNIKIIEEKISKKASEFKADHLHSKTPSALKYLYMRINESLRIFEK